jgi:hypothetical protein
MSPIKRTIRLVAVTGIASLLAAHAASAAPVGNIYASLAPNIDGSPSFPAYDSNAMTALQNGASTGGTIGQPSYYSQIADGANLIPGDFIVTDFPSWMGNADPGTTFGTAYANELGTRIHYGAVISGNGAKISISQLSFNIAYNDTTHTDLSLFSVAEGAYVYDSDHEGVIFGVGGPTYVTSGPNTQPVDEIITRGSAIGYAVLTSDTGATNQDKIDNWLAPNFGSDPYSFTGQYSIDSSLVTEATENFNSVPEPASLGMLGVFGVSMLVGRRRGEANRGR